MGNTETIKMGQIYKLGNHLIMCGDATDPHQVKELMGGEKATLVFTDPPYGMKKERHGVRNDNLNSNDLLEFNKKWIPNTFDNLTKNGSWYCWGNDEPLMDIYSEILKPMINDKEITFRNLITWDKHTAQGQKSSLIRSYANVDEKCLFVMCGVQVFDTNSKNYYVPFDKVRLYLAGEAKKVGLSYKKCQQITGTSSMYKHWFTKSQWAFISEKHYTELQQFYKNQNAFTKDWSVLKTQYDAIKKHYDLNKDKWYARRAYFNNAHDNMNSVWHFERANNEERKHAGNHPTIKPVKLCMRAIKTSSRPQDIILDVFGGSGSTLVACEMLGRKARIMELNPKWVKVMINRWEELTGKKAALL